MRQVHRKAPASRRHPALETIVSLEALLPQIEDPQRPVGTAQLTVLSNIEGEERERFLQVWRSLSVQRRRDIIDRLAELAEDNVELDFSNVFLAGLVDDDVQVRADSIKALWDFDGREIIGPLLTLLRDPEALVRADAALGLGRFLLRAELDGRDDARTRDIEDALRAVIADERELSEVRGRALEAAGARSKDWVRDAISDAYEGGDRRLRISAVHAMGRNCGTAWLPALLEETESDDAEMRYEAARAAGALGDEAAVPQLALLADDDDAEVQEAAIEALGEIGGPSARSVLQSVAEEHDDGRVRVAVAEALAAADFAEDPLGMRVRAGSAAAEDEDEDDDE